MTEFPRALVDTSVWISAFINQHGCPARILDVLTQGQFIPIVSLPLLREIAEVASRERVRRRIQQPDEQIARFLSLIAESAQIVTPTGTIHLCRDAKDDIFLETALIGQADYAVSRDDDWKRDLDLIGYLRDNGVIVLSVAQFLAILDKR